MRIPLGADWVSAPTAAKTRYNDMSAATGDPRRWPDVWFRFRETERGQAMVNGTFDQHLARRSTAFMEFAKIPPEHVTLIERHLRDFIWSADGSVEEYEAESVLANLIDAVHGITNG